MPNRRRCQSMPASGTMNVRNAIPSFDRSKATVASTVHTARWFVHQCKILKVDVVLEVSDRPTWGGLMYHQIANGRHRYVLYASLMLLLVLSMGIGFQLWWTIQDGGRPSITAKPLNFFQANLDYAKAVAESCNRQKINDTDDRAQRIWRATPEGISCANANHALKLDLLQRRDAELDSALNQLKETMHRQ